MRAKNSFCFPINPTTILPFM